VIKNVSFTELQKYDMIFLMREVYTYQPEEWARVSVVEDRASYLAAHLATIIGGKYVDGIEYPNAGQPGIDMTLMPYDSVDPSEPIANRVEGDSGIYGAVVDRLKGTKSICHTPFCDEGLPSSYDDAFSSRIDELGVKPMGFVVFGIDDAVDAIDFMKKRGSGVRIKLPLGSGVDNQKIIDSGKPSSLQDWIKSRVEGDHIQQYGLVIEEEVLPSSSDLPFALSTGELVVSEEHYTYVGWQVKGENGQYGGTVLRLTRGRQHPENVANIPGNLAEVANVVTQASRDMLVEKAGRMNFNYLYGAGAGDTTDRLILTEPTFRPGGASAAELMAIEALLEDSSLPGIWARTSVEYGGRPSQQFRQEGKTVWTGSEKKYGVTAIKASTSNQFSCL
jgi:hypothetical protein